MLQKNSFFSYPVTFFGAQNKCEDEGELEKEEWTFVDHWNLYTSNRKQEHPIGVFIVWSEKEFEFEDF